MMETAEAAGPAAPTETIEAVIISGPRRGEIVRLPEEVTSKASEEAIQVLNVALEEASATIDRISREVRDLRTALHSGLDRLQSQVYEVRERLARLETHRDADHALMQAHLKRLEFEAERAGLQLTRLRST